MAEQQIQIQMDDQTAKGAYTNMAIVAHNENEFVVDFVFVHPPLGKVVSRIITSPSHAKMLMKALAENISQYEKKFGAIPEPKQPPPPAMGIQISKN